MHYSANLIGLVVLALVATFGQLAAAGQGCPFDDGSCQEYCNQQGCNMGYCGHFAWIQCICRKCGDEWSWYDKVRYNPDKTVNQTELDSLKLNGTAPLILTSSSTEQLANSSRPERPQQPAQPSQQQQQQQQQQQPQLPQQQKPAATLTTLLIPDLSDSKLDLNDIPDENSDKFLDYLAKNHEKLVQATSARANQQQQQQRAAATARQTSEDLSSDLGSENGELNPNEGDEEDSTGSSSGTADDETVEIQISSSNNSGNSTISSQEIEVKPANGGQPKESSITRLLKMAVIERSSEEID